MDEYKGVLRVASGQTWGNGDVYLTTFSVEDLDNIEQLGKATLKIDERLTSARFDGYRGYLVSYRNIDPLFTFDLTDPKSLSETREYIRTRLERVVASSQTRRLFGWPTIVRLWRRSGGNPRLLNLQARGLIDPSSAPPPV